MEENEKKLIEKNDQVQNSSQIENKNEEKKLEENKEDTKIQTRKNFFYGFAIIGRIIFTLYSLHGLFFIYNIATQYIILFPSLLYTGDIPGWARIPFIIIYILFAITSSNLLVIPTYEFFSFPFLFYKEPLAHIYSFYYMYKEKKYTIDDARKNYNQIAIGIFIIVQILYLVGLVLGYAFNNIKFKDYIKITILFIIYIYYSILILSYFIYSFYLIIIIIKNWWKDKKNFNNIINDYYKDKEELPNVNLFSNIINPYILKNYKDKNNNELNEEEVKKCTFDNGFSKGIIIIKFLSIIFSVVCAFIILILKMNFWLDRLFFFLFYIIIIIISITLNFPLFYRNQKTFGTFTGCCGIFCCKGKNNFICTDIKYNYKTIHPHIVSISRFIGNVIFFLASITFVYLFYKENATNEYNENFFKNITHNENKIDTKKILLPNVCYSSIYNMPLLLFFPFINDAYYYGNINSSNITSSFEIEEYKNLFFDEDIEIDVIGNLVKRNDTVKMIQYNVKNKKNYLTILSIKGTSYNTDIYIDAQLYFSSILLSLLSSFSLLTTKDSLTFNFIEYSLNIPYRIFFRFLLVDDYMNELKKAFIENEYTFYNNVVITGHSLGGGLSKLFGRYMRKQAISLSGPGINAFHSLWNFKGNSENFEISAIDLIPDMDLVPRVEISGGTVYRIICKEGVFDCHGKELSFCETLIMCRHPNYEKFCEKMAGLNSDKIKAIFESSELNE